MGGAPPEPVETEGVVQPSARRFRMFATLRWLVACLVVAASLWLLRGFDFGRVATTLRSARWPLVLLAAAVNVTLNTSARTMRWRALLPPSPHTGKPVAFTTLAGIVLAGLAMNSVLPFRVGEAARTIGLNERSGHEIRIVVASQLIEKIVEIAALATFAIPVIFAPDLPRALVTRSLGLVAAAIAAVMSFSAWRRFAARRHRRRLAEGALEGPPAANGPVRRFVRQVREAFHLLGHSRAWLQSYAWGLASYVVDVTTIALCTTAVGIHVGPLSWCAILIGVNVAIAIPMTPGQVGVLEAGAVLVLAWLGIDQERALSFALLYHGVHLVPFTAAGLLVLGLPRARRRAAVVS